MTVHVIPVSVSAAQCIVHVVNGVGAWTLRRSWTVHSDTFFSSFESKFSSLNHMYADSWARCILMYPTLVS